jgi:hypothetical protein
MEKGIDCKLVGLKSRCEMCLTWRKLCKWGGKTLARVRGKEYVEALVAEEIVQEGKNVEVVLEKRVTRSGAKPRESSAPSKEASREIEEVREELMKEVEEVQEEVASMGGELFEGSGRGEEVERVDEERRKEKGESSFLVIIHD